MNGDIHWNESEPMPQVHWHEIDEIVLVGPSGKEKCIYSRPQHVANVPRGEPPPRRTDPKRFVARFADPGGDVGPLRDRLRKLGGPELSEWGWLE